MGRGVIVKVGESTILMAQFEVRTIRFPWYAVCPDQQKETLSRPKQASDHRTAWTEDVPPCHGTRLTTWSVGCVRVERSDRERLAPFHGIGSSVSPPSWMTIGEIRPRQAPKEVPRRSAHLYAPQSHRV